MRASGVNRRVGGTPAQKLKVDQDVKESGRATAQKAAECSATYVLIMALRAALRSRSANLSTR